LSRAVEAAHVARHLRAWRFKLGLALATLVVGMLALLARSAPYFSIDLQVARAVQSIEAPWLDLLLAAVTWVGMPPQTVPIFGTIVLVLFLVGLRLEALLTLFAAVSGAGLWYLTAELVARPRPSPELVRAAADLPFGSFPSGHALNLTAIFGFLCYLCFVYARPGWTRRLLLVVTALPVLTIGFARVRDGAHWPSDVLGGHLLGGILLAITIDLYHRARHRHADPSEDTASPSSAIGGEPLNRRRGAAVGPKYSPPVRPEPVEGPLSRARSFDRLRTNDMIEPASDRVTNPG
jgi:membrane-associated phospholipid phosphatase